MVCITPSYELIVIQIPNTVIRSGVTIAIELCALGQVPEGRDCLKGLDALVNIR